MFASIEAGGTKFVCGVGDASGSRALTTIPTREAAVTLGEVAAFLDEAVRAHGPLKAIGIASFGPIELDPAAPGYGSITTTPKLHWQGVDMPRTLRARFGVPVAINTDVNAAALAEARLHDVDRLAYVTVGTGVGVGLVIDGRPQAGFGHPEAGHIPVRRHQAHEQFAGVCPYHGDCLEGLASGPAVTAAWGGTLADLDPDHIAWLVEASYVAQLCATLILTLAPKRIVLGGGVMQQARLFSTVRAETLRVLGDYCAHWDAAAVEERITAPLCDEPSGLVGGYLLAEGAV